MQTAEGRNKAEHLEALQARLAVFEERLKKPMTIEDTKAELIALKSALGVGQGEETVGSAAAKEIATESLPDAVPPTTLFDPEAVATVLIAKTHDAATAMEVLEAKGATVEGSPNGPVIRTKSGEVLAFEEGIATLLPAGLLKPAGHAGSGGRGGITRVRTEQIPPGSMLQRFADSGNDPNFYRANRDAILRERYGRAPMTRLSK